MPVVSIQIQESKSFIATGQFSGTITIFKYADAKNGLVKVGAVVVESTFQF